MITIWHQQHQQHQWQLNSRNSNSIIKAKHPQSIWMHTNYVIITLIAENLLIRHEYLLKEVIIILLVDAVYRRYVLFK